MKHEGTFKTGVSRRTFLAAGAGFGLFNIVPASVLGADAPSNKVTMALIGAGGMGSGNMRTFLGLPDVRVLAVCDVNRVKQERGKATVDKHYGNKDCATYRDFRDVCNRDDIDAVILATPDHWHAVIGIYAANCGKDIYGEKPFSHDLREGRALVRAVERNGRVWQTGSWQRSSNEMRRAVELVKNGRIGKIARVEVGLPGGHGLHLKGIGVPGAKVPDGLDWDMWVGPAPERPFEGVYDWDWRWVSDWGGGQLMDWIGHHGDIAQWGLGTDLTGPVSFEGYGEEYRKGIFDTPQRYRVECEYANGVKMTVAGGVNEIRGGTKWIGENGEWVWVNRGQFEASSRVVRESRIEAGEIRLKSPGHHRQFIDCVKNRDITLTPAEIAHRSASIGHLCRVAIDTHRKIKWDPATERIIGDAAAEPLLQRPIRAPWKLV
ncbi:MAG: Gfo/Idh/MocA family oxidoreductase [Kiritimatiellae bacterium]|nr:Gfo/Idh/MocA family oxidoreductase [Kiritimatiellia bacterium]